MTLFWILAAAMLAVALAIVLRPLLRRERGDASVRAKRAALLQAQRAGALGAHEVRARLAALDAGAPAASPPSRLMPLLLALALPLSAVLIYREIGEPRALDPVWRDATAIASGAAPTSPGPAEGASAPSDAPDMEKAVVGLAERLRNQPDDLEGWMLLGRAYKMMERFAPAREALANAFRLAPDDADVMIEYAEAQVLASDTRRFEGEALQLLERALQAQPDSQRGLWLRGIAAFQRQDYGVAVGDWERLLALLPAEADVRDSLIERIAEARQRAGMAPPTASVATPAEVSPATAEAPSEAPAAADAASAGPRLTVTVDVAPELKARIGASDVLFVFARAAQGPRMPLAIQRLPAAPLPVTVTLDDSTSMMPALKLSTMPQVVVGARISKSGQATPQPGDFETLSAPIANTHAEPLQLLIDTVVP